MKKESITLPVYTCTNAFEPDQGACPRYMCSLGEGPGNCLQTCARNKPECAAHLPFLYHLLGCVLLLFHHQFLQYHR